MKDANERAQAGEAFIAEGEDIAPPPGDDDAPPEADGDGRAEPRQAPPPPDPVDAMVDRLNACDLRAVAGRALPWLMRTARGEERPVPVPWDGLARELGGGYHRGAHVIVGNPKAGKSQLVLEVARHAAAKGHPVAYVSLELDEEQVFARMLALESGAPWSRLVLGELALGEVEKLARDHAAAVEGLPVHVLGADARTWPVAELALLPEALGRLHPEASGRRPLLILDYLQIVGGEERELRERIGAAAYAARTAARRSGAAVLLVSSTAREAYGRLDRSAGKAARSNDDKVPLGSGSPIRFLALGKESGEVEYAADSVAVLVRDHERVPGPAARRAMPLGRANGASTVWVAMAATRARPKGATGWASLAFDGARFYDDPAPEAIGGRPQRGFDAAEGF